MADTSSGMAARLLLLSKPRDVIPFLFTRNRLPMMRTFYPRVDLLTENELVLDFVFTSYLAFN